jgi:hypothetical protein
MLKQEVLMPQESRTYWFNASTLEAEDEFMLIGLVLGLAIYNGVLLDFPLPIALYRKLLGQQAGLRDLCDMDPTLGRSLNQLLDFDGKRRCTACSRTPSLSAASLHRLEIPQLQGHTVIVCTAQPAGQRLPMCPANAERSLRRGLQRPGRA